MEEAKKSEMTPIQSRLSNSTFEIFVHPATGKETIFQHSALCQTFFPYRNLGEDVKMWQQKQGLVNLAVSATPILNPHTGLFEYAGIPYGPKARLILAYLNTQAVKKQNKMLDVEESMSAFIKSMGLNTDGRTIREVKEQIRRISTSNISLGFIQDERVKQVDFKIVRAFEFWFPKDERQRVLWESSIELTDEYFESLVQHAIPLDERALAALAHNAMALDIYAWLAQRLHRVDRFKPQFVGWQNLKEQFGMGYSEIRKFRQVFKKTLEIVKNQYLDAKFVVDDKKGMYLHNSPPPIPPKTRVFLGDNKF
ncbi:plasmid encoded RepA protein [Runella sp. CRIBMP]|uniref:replication protein RepA n=1 Tax=Runella sp. CRIBMP TaxID=2683261 RepID=UPI001411FF5E|nr:replication protein RepA [Runella sp. CRIBMP]NBB23423.1 plasmid encoded RepA protein [Runella sp. CRIBMP]